MVEAKVTPSFLFDQRARRDIFEKKKQKTLGLSEVQRSSSGEALDGVGYEGKFLHPL